MPTNYFPNGYTEMQAVAWGSEDLKKMFVRMPDGTLKWVHGAIDAVPIESLTWENDGSITIPNINATSADITNLQVALANLTQIVTDQLTVGGTTITNIVSPGSYIYKMNMSNNVTDPTNDIDVEEGECTSDDTTSAARVILNPGAMTKQLDAAWAAGTNQGGRIGSLADGTWHVFAFKRSGGTDDICFAQSLTPTLPDSGTKKRRIGSIMRVSSAIIPFLQRGNCFTLKSLIQSVETILTNPGTNWQLVTLTVPTGVRFRAFGMVCNEAPDTGAAIFGTYIQDPQNTEFAGTPVFPFAVSTPLSGGGTLRRASCYWESYTDTSARVNTKLTFSNTGYVTYVSAYGWFDDRF